MAPPWSLPPAALVPKRRMRAIPRFSYSEKIHCKDVRNKEERRRPRQLCTSTRPSLRLSKSRTWSQLLLGTRSGASLMITLRTTEIMGQFSIVVLLPYQLSCMLASAFCFMFHMAKAPSRRTRQRMRAKGSPMPKSTGNVSSIIVTPSMPSSKLYVVYRSLLERSLRKKSLSRKAWKVNRKSPTAPSKGCRVRPSETRPSASATASSSTTVASVPTTTAVASHLGQSRINLLP